MALTYVQSAFEKVEINWLIEARKDVSKVESAKLYARDKHKGMTRDDGTTPHFVHLEAVVSRLKSIGVTDEDVLCAGWLHDTIEDTDTTFDDVHERFGQRIAVLVFSLSKDGKLPKKQREIQYVKQLREASFDAKLVKLCDISANLKDLENSGMSKNKKKKTINQKIHYLKVIKNDISQNKSDYPKVSALIDGINQIIGGYHQKPVII